MQITEISPPWIRPHLSFSCWVVNARHPPRLDSASGKTLMHFPCFDLCLTAWRESEIVFHGTVVGTTILDFFAMGVILDDLEVVAFLFGIVTIIALTDFDLHGWNTGRRLVALRLLLGWSLLHGLGLVAHYWLRAGCCLRCARWLVCATLQGLALRVGLIVRRARAAGFARTGCCSLVAGCWCCIALCAAAAAAWFVLRARLLLLLRGCDCWLLQVKTIINSEIFFSFF